MSALAEVRDQTRKIEFKNVLFATDFSEASQRAFAYAVAIARQHNSTLLVVHAIPPDVRQPIPIEPLRPELNRRLIEAEQQMKSLEQAADLDGLKHRFFVDQGRVSDLLEALVKRHSVDLLVLGTRGRSGLRKAILGSVAEEVLRISPCPVLTVGPHVSTAKEPKIFTRILFATDFEAAAQKAFPYALGLAEAYQAKLVLLHMMPPLPTPDVGPAAYGVSTYGTDEFIEWQRRMKLESVKKLKESIPSNARLAAEPEYVSGMDFLPEGILEVVTTHRVDLIVMGADRTAFPRLTAHIPWVLTHEVISQAPCPVLTIST
jgi:nucleotide-binding universal stress UspA family protein